MDPLLGFDGRPGHNPARFLGAACLEYIVWWIPRTVDLPAMKLLFFRVLNLLGGHSLRVFAFSLLVIRFEANLVQTSSSGATFCGSADRIEPRPGSMVPPVLSEVVVGD